MYSTVNSIKSFLEDTSGFTVNRLKDKLTAIGTLYSVTIPTYASLIAGYPTSKQYPQIGILPINVSYNEDLGNPAFRKAHRVAIAIINAGTQEKEIQDQLMWYCEAIENLINLTPNLVNRVIYSEVTGIDFGEMISNQKSRLTLQVATIELKIFPQVRADEISIN